MIVAAISFLSGAALCGVWYWLAFRHNRRKAVLALRWIEAAVAGRGHVTGVRWIAGSQFKVALRLTSGVFQRAWMIVQFSPCEMPLRWLLAKMQKRQDLVTFNADLDLVPTFSLDVHNFRWFARSSRKAAPADRHWTFEQTGPFVISTRLDWQKEITSTMSSLACNSNREFLSICFRQRSPHFSVTLPLEALSPSSPIRNYMFDSMREMASSSSASLF
jgi:hypothetical protein